MDHGSEIPVVPGSHRGSLAWFGNRFRGTVRKHKIAVLLDVRN